MENFLINYEELNKDLTRFMDDLSNKFKDKQPGTLQYVKVIPAMLTTNDPVFTTGDAKRVLEKFSVVVNATNHVFKYLLPHVQDQAWAQSQKRKLEWWMDLCGDNLYLAISKPPSYRVTGSSPGISASNPGVQMETDYENWKKLRALYDDIEKFFTKLRA